MPRTVAGQASETTPLIRDVDADSLEDDPEAYAKHVESAFSIGLDPSASAFLVPEVVPEEDGEPVRGAPTTEPPKERSQAEVLLILTGVWIGTFLAAFDSTIVATILSTIGSDFHRSNDIGWLGTSYLLTQCAFQPLYGRFSDIFGRKVATLFASIVFLIGSLGCGLSRNFPQLIAARAVAGIGGGGLTSMASIVTSDLVALEDRGIYQGYGNLVYAAGAALGGPLGGLLGDTIGWQWAFLIQVPLCVLHATVVFFKVNIPSGPGDMMTKLKKIDVFGAITLVSAVALFLLGMSLGGNEQPWDAPIVWGSILAALVLLVAFVLVEKYVAKLPVLPLNVLFDRTPAAVCLTNWFISMSQFGILFNVPLYFSAVEQTTTSYAGLHLLPNALLASAMSLSAGFIIKATGKYKMLILGLGLLAILGPAMMVSWQRGSTAEVFYWFSMCPAGIGYGGIITGLVVALIAAVPVGDQAAAIGVSYLFRATGSVLGISLTNAILQNSLKSKLAAALHGADAHKIIEGIRGDVGYIRTLSGATREAAINAYQDSMRLVFVAVLVAAVLAFLCSLPLGVHSLTRR